MFLNAFRLICLLMVLAICGIWQVHAQDAPVWEEPLRAQLLAEHRCKLNFLTNLREFDVGVLKGIDARAHCVDGRAFDVTTTEDGKKFEIRACAPVEC